MANPVRKGGREGGRWSFVTFQGDENLKEVTIWAASSFFDCPIQSEFQSVGDHCVFFCFSRWALRLVF